MSNTPTDINALRLEHAHLMSAVYCEYNGVPNEITGCTDEQLIAWANRSETRDRVGIDEWLEP